MRSTAGTKRPTGRPTTVITSSWRRSIPPTPRWDSTFWRNRKIAGAEDSRFAGKDWFTALSGQQVEAGAQGVDELETRAATLADLWQHNRNEVTDQFDGTELSLRRLRWAGQLMQEFRRMARITWVSDEVRLVPSFKVHPTTFALERQHFIGDEYGRTMTTYALSEDHRRLFESLKSDPLSYRELAGRLKRLRRNAGQIAVSRDQAALRPVGRGDQQRGGDLDEPPSC